MSPWEGGPQTEKVHPPAEEWELWPYLDFFVLAYRSDLSNQVQTSLSTSSGLRMGCLWHGRFEGKKINSSTLSLCVFYFLGEGKREV